MTVRHILDRYYEGTSEDEKPTGVIPTSYFRETDTYHLYKTFDGDNWVRADWGLLDNVAALEHYHHSRSRVYPQDIEAVADLIAAGANVFGDWAEVIPLNIVDFDYEVTGFVIEVAAVATTYLVQLGFSITDTDPDITQIAGERRTRLPVPATKSTELLEIKSQNIPAKAKLWGRVKSKAGGTETIGISVVAARHIEITNPVAKLETWPWST